MIESPEVIKEKKVPHQGKTLRMLRNVSSKTQLQVAKDLGMSQSKIFELEIKDQLSDKELQIFAQYYGVTVVFLKTFDVDALSQGNVTTNYNTLNDHSSLNSETNNYNHPLKKSQNYMKG